MKKKLFFAAVALVALASCSDNEFIGDNSPTTQQENAADEIQFSFDMQKVTRGDIAGKAAADLLGNNFYVTGTKGTEANDSPTPTLVFDNYLVHFGANTAGTTESNTANWEYVGVTPGSSPTENYVKIGSYYAQTIKYWDYSVPQYDFFGFSTGTFAAVNGSSTGAGNIGVTAMNYGSSLASSGTAYTFDIPSVDAIKSTYITDIVEVKKEDNAYGKDVTLKFKNLGSKVRVALYETVPGYQVTDVVFYAVDGTTGFGDTKSTEGATLISANTNGLPTKGTITVYFPHVGDNNDSEQDYNKAAATVAPVTASSTKTLTFGDLDNFETTKEGYEPDYDGATPTPNAYHYIGRTLPTATFAGSEDAKYYQTVFPVSVSDPLTLRLDYKLVSIDGSNEVINVYGAKAVVPATYTKWLPNYAYTYIFKISDNTNGWTSKVSTDPQGLFPITFDAVVAEATDATGEQTTVTTVATPSITTYQQNHTYTTNEYSQGTGKNIYVQVMNNDNTTSPSLVTTLSTSNSLLYAIDASHASTATEAMVMDALEKRTTASGDDVTGRNGIVLTKDATNISITNEIENGVDNNKITVDNNSAAKIAISGLTAPGTYAFVYDYTSGSKTDVVEFQPIAVEGSTVGESGKTYYTIDATTLNGIAVTTAAETVDNAYVYFSKTQNGTGTTTYSYISITGKANMTLPAGVVKVAKTSITATVAGGATKVDGTFYFEKYFSNNGKYAVKVIKIIA